MRLDIPGDCQTILADETKKTYFKNLTAFVTKEYQTQQIFPPQEDLFSALRLTPYHDVKVVILGQDPYHGVGQAHGLAFSVKPGIKVPPSLRNIYQELNNDLGIAPVSHGYLVSWAKQGVLLLNTVLTVRSGAANSHRQQGWEQFTDAIIGSLAQRPEPVIFVLWGAPAQAKAKMIDPAKHMIITSPHPSPLSAYRGFFGSKVFSRINEGLLSYGETPIDWQLPDTV